MKSHYVKIVVCVCLIKIRETTKRFVVFLLSRKFLTIYKETVRWRFQFFFKCQNDVTFIKGPWKSYFLLIIINKKKYFNNIFSLKLNLEHSVTLYTSSFHVRETYFFSNERSEEFFRRICNLHPFSKCPILSSDMCKKIRVTKMHFGEFENHNQPATTTLYHLLWKQILMVISVTVHQILRKQELSQMIGRCWIWMVCVGLHLQYTVCNRWRFNFFFFEFQSTRCAVEVSWLW